MDFNDDITEKIVVPKWLTMDDIGDWDLTEEPRCECGSSKTSNPNLHVFWCPLYKDPMGN
jgi:hypothetical protein